MPTRRALLGMGLLAGLVPKRLARAGTPAGRAASAPAKVDWREIRRRFLIPEGYAYLNTGTLGASPRDVVDATTSHLRAVEEHLVDVNYYDDPEPPLSGYDRHDRVRDKLAAFVGAARDEIALTQNATMAMNFIAQGLDIAQGDEIVTTDQEHPGGICPWQSVARRRGAVVKTVAVTGATTPSQYVQAFADAIGPKTRVVWSSHLTSGLGLLLPGRDLCKLARDKRVISVLDGAQVVGQLQVDVHALGCDYYVGSPHKWLCAPKGCGFLYVRKEMLERTWTTLASAQWDNREWGAARLQQFGTGNMALLHGLEAAIDFQNGIGRAAIETRDRALTKRLRAGLAEIPKVRISSSRRPDMTAAVTTFLVEGRASREVQDALWKSKVRVRAVGDALGVRCGTHYYVLDQDVDRLLEVVRTL